MPIFPFYPNYYNYYYYNKRKQNKSTFLGNNYDKNTKNNEDDKDNKNDSKSTATKYNKRSSNFVNLNISALLENDINTPILEIFGIKLYLDDLIIIGLLFFLYKEEVQDEILFGILLLLLLS